MNSLRALCEQRQERSQFGGICSGKFSKAMKKYRIWTRDSQVES
jgi:hypothetical protein